MAVPTVELDTTIAQLYRDHGIRDACFVTTHCVFAHLDLHPEFPRETVYPEDEEPVPYSADETERARLRKIILGLKPVKRAFALGDLDVLFFTPGAAEHNVKQVFSQLPPHQRPIARYADLARGHVRAQLLALSRGKKLVYWRPQGWMREHDCLVDTAMMYAMSSKEYLITSGIKTPPSEMVSIAADDAAVLEARAPRLAAAPLPFVVKLPLAGCGYGTWIVRSEMQRQKMLLALAKFRAQGLTQVMLSKYINLTADLSVHLVVGAPGDPHDHNDPLVVGVTVQNLTANGVWLGGSIDYSVQAELQALTAATVRETCRLLPKGFVGWAGLDIVVDEDGGQWVVDLNPRFTGSIPLCVLSGHFFKRRGLRFAEFAVFQYKGATDDVWSLLEQEVQSGKVVVTAFTNIDDNLNIVDVVWGGRDKDDLVETTTVIKAKLDRK